MVNLWLDVLCALKKDGLCIPPCDNSSFNRIKENTTKELFVRMLYSSLVDADSLDTEQHFEKEQYDARPPLSWKLSTYAIKQKTAWLDHYIEKRYQTIIQSFEQLSKETIGVNKGCRRIWVFWGQG